MPTEDDGPDQAAAINDGIDSDETEATPSSTSPSSSTSIWLVIGAAIVVLVGLVAVFAGGESSPTAAADSDLFAFEFGTADGGTTTLASHAGEPLVVNYFAAWCPPCRAELPDFEAVSQERLDDVTFIGVSKDNTTDAWTGLIEETGVTFETVFEGNSSGTYEIVGGLAMPTTAFVTADGEIAHVHSGILNDQLLNQLIDEHLS